MGLTDAQHAAVDEWLAVNAPDDAPLVKALLTAGELSNGDPSATSPKGARGLMQLTPIALKDIGRDPATFDYDNPAESMRAGVEYVQKLKTDYGLTNPLQIAAAYNAGPGTVKEAVAKGGIAYLPAETRGYVARMAKALGDTTETTETTKVAMPLMSDALDPVDRTAVAPLAVPNRLATMDPPFLESLPFEPGGPIERQAAGEALDSTLPFLIPPGSSVGGATAIGAGIAGVGGIRQVIGKRMAQSTAQGPTAKLFDALGQTSGDDLAAIGQRMVIGGAVGAASYGVARMLTGAMRGMEPSRTRPLPPPSPLETIPPASPLHTLPPPTPPTDDMVAAVTRREIQAGEKAAAQAIVGKASGIEPPIYPGPVQDAAIISLRRAVPQPDRQTTNQAYEALRDAYAARTGDAPVDVTEIVDALAGMRAAIRARAGTVPAAIDPTDLQVIPFDPTPPEMIGSGARMAQRWLAPLGAVQRKMSAINALKNNAMERAAGGVEAADLKYLSHRVYEGLSGQLEGREKYLLDFATDVARNQARLGELQVLLDKTVNANGVPVGKVGAATLLRDPKGWQQALGDFYDPALRWFQTVAKLQEKEIGAKAVEAITKATQGDAMAMAQAQQGNLDTLLGDAMSQAQVMDRNFATLANDARARAGAMASNTAAAISQAARPPALGASAGVRHGVEAALGAAAGAGVATAFGGSPGYGATLGALGGGLATRIIDPVFRQGFDAMARHPVGSQAFFQEAGRLSLILAPPLEPDPTMVPVDQPTPMPTPLGPGMP